MNLNESNTCRIENIGKYSIPICGHDLLTEFMVQDLKTKPTNGILLYGALYANESENRFFWYVSTMRSFSLEKIPSTVNEGIRVRDYLSEVTKGDRLLTLYKTFQRPLPIHENDEDFESLIELGLLSMKDNSTVTITGKGIELCCVLAHLTVNHRIKPPPKQLNEIFNSFAKVGLYSGESDWQPDPSLTPDTVMEILGESGELEHLQRSGIEIHNLHEVILLYLCPPF